MPVKVSGERADMVKVSTSRCPHCSALLARGADWCSLCLTDLRPAPEPVVVDPVESLTVVDAVPLDLAATSSPARARGKHARRPEGAVLEHEVVDAEVADGPPAGLAASLMAIRESTSLEAVSATPSATDADRLDLDDIDLSVLAGAGSPSVIDDWSLKAQTPGAKVGLMVVGVTVVGGIALLLLTIAGLVLR